MAPDINVNIQSESGDRTGGDKLSAGDITGDGIAVGRQASAGGMAGHMNDFIAQIMQRLHDLERRIIQLEVRSEYEHQRDRHDQASISTGWIAVVGGMISIALIILLVWLATGGTP